MPIAASTICLLMLSLDRYATVRNPRLGQLNQRRCLSILLAAAGWIAACLICLPMFFVYETIKTGYNDSTTFGGTTPLMTAKQQLIARQRGFNYPRNQLSPQDAATVTCRANYGSTELHTAHAIVHALLVFIVPAFGVLMNHLGVRQRLCALSLTARAAHGELPLPMPILRRPTHMIIVTGMANVARAAGGDQSSEDDDGVAENTDRRLTTRLKQVPRTPR